MSHNISEANKSRQVKCNSSSVAIIRRAIEFAMDIGVFAIAVN